MSAAIKAPLVAHEPFPIADMDAGMYTAKEPWLSPQNAFSEIRDGYTFRSRLHRRTGFERFAPCGVSSGGGTVTSSMVGGTTQYDVDSATTRVALESLSFTYTDSVFGPLAANVVPGSWGYQDWNAVNQYGLSIVETGTSNQIGACFQQYTNSGGSDIAAQAFIIWTDHSDYDSGDATFGSMTYETDPSLPITGIASYRDTAGEEYLVCANTTRFFLYDTTDEYFKDSIGSDTFTGTESDQMWFWPAGDILLVTNGVDTPKKYTGSTDTLAAITTTIGAGPDTVSAAEMAVLFRNRVVYINNVEGGTSYPLRARWTGAGAYETLDAADYVDAPSEMGTAVTAEFIADRLLVGFENGWMELVFTGDSRELFRFEKTTYVHGSNARLGTVPDGARILTRTQSGIEALDPNEQYPADIAIPDYVLDKLDTGNAGFTFGYRSSQRRQFWWAAVNAVASAARPNEVLVAQYQEDDALRWSAYDVPFNCFADYRSSSTPTWDDIDTNWDDYEELWDSSAGIAGFPITLAGHNDGTIYRAGVGKDKINDNPTTDPTAIPFTATTERLSPFPGFRAHLGWVDIYLEASAGTEITVEFRGNSRSAAYRATSFSLTPTGANEKLYRRIMVNKSASFHRITLNATTGGTFAVDAIIPWFRRAGRMRNFG